MSNKSERKINQLNWKISGRNCHELKYKSKYSLIKKVYLFFWYSMSLVMKCIWLNFLCQSYESHYYCLLKSGHLNMWLVKSILKNNPNIVTWHRELLSNVKQNIRKSLGAFETNYLTKSNKIPRPRNDCYWFRTGLCIKTWKCVYIWVELVE